MRIKINILCILTLGLIFSNCEPNKHAHQTGEGAFSEMSQIEYEDIRVGSVEAFRKAVGDAKAGERILLEDGIYENIGNLTIKVKGTKEKPVLIEPATPHQVVFTGEMSWRLEGQHITFRGIDFIDAINTPTEENHATLISSGDESEFLRFSGCRFINCELERKENGKSKGRLIMLYGNNHRFDHSFFYDCIGGILGIKGFEKLADRKEKGFAKIDHNIFREMSRHRKLKDQGEAIILGVGFEHYSFRRIGAVVEHNIFDRAIGDTHGEIITVKGSDNIFRNNLFVNSPGAWWAGGAHLCLRSTDNCQVYNNIFQNLGCGVWVTGNNHRIYNNFFKDIDYAGLLFPAGNIAGIQDNEGVYMIDGVYLQRSITPDFYKIISEKYGAAFRPAKSNFIVHNYFGGLKRMAIRAYDNPKSKVGNLPIEKNIIANNVFEWVGDSLDEPFMNIQYPDLNTISHNQYVMHPDKESGQLGENAIQSDKSSFNSENNIEIPFLISSEQGSTGSADHSVTTDFYGQNRSNESPTIGPQEEDKDLKYLETHLPPVPPMPGSLNEKPIDADFELFYQKVAVGEYLVLDAAHSSGNIMEYTWDFGDGNTSSSRGNAIAHRWLKSGAYQVELTVSDGAGNLSKTVQKVEVY